MFNGSSSTSLSAVSSFLNRFDSISEWTSGLKFGLLVSSCSTLSAMYCPAGHLGLTWGKFRRG